MTDMERIERMFQQIDGNMKNINTKMDAMVLEVRQIRGENEKLKKMVAKHEERIDDLEREIRKKNLVIRGVEDEEGESESETRGKIATIMQKIDTNIDMNREIEQIRRIGSYNGDRKRPILVKLIKENTKFALLRNARRLKGTDVWIDEDFSREVQDERRLLVPHLKEARNKGYRAHLKYNKLIVNNEVYRAGDVGVTEGLEKGMSIENISQKRTLSDRSPDGATLEEQVRKVTRTYQKN